MTDPRIYRIHWNGQADDREAIRWSDVQGALDARRTALSTLAKSVDGSIRVALLGTDGQELRHVLTGTQGVSSWKPVDDMPESTDNAWTARLADGRRRRAAVAEVKAKLVEAHGAGLIELSSAAQLAAALDLALAAGVRSAIVRLD